MKKEKNKVFWIAIGIGVIIIILLMVIGNIITIGDKLAKINKWVEIGFYVLAGLLVYFLLINPLRIILFSPTFQVPTVLDSNHRKVKKIYKRVTKNLLASKMISDESVANLQNGLKNKSELHIELNKVYNNDIKKEINKIILNNAKTVMISTAISQNGKLDMFTVLAVNLKMIKEIVERCGFRPSYKNLGKLSVNVLATALISEGLENLDLNELFPSSSLNFLSEIPFLKTIASSLMQGISNAFLTLRIGVITRKYLFSESPIKSKAKIRSDAFKESAKMIPVVVKNGIMLFPEKIRKMFTKKDKNANDYEV